MQLNTLIKRFQRRMRNEMIATHLDMVSGPRWKCFCISQVTAPVRHRRKKMVSCSFFVTCFESSRPAYIWSSCTSFQNTCFDIPMLSWKQTGWPFKSSCSQASLERAESYIGVLIRCRIIYCPTAAQQLQRQLSSFCATAKPGQMPGGI